MTTEQRGVLLHRVSPYLALDLAGAEISALVSSPATKELADRIVRGRPVRAFLLYGSGAVLSLASMAVGIGVGAWLVGLPFHPDESLAKDYPLSFMIKAQTDPWYRYLFLVAFVALANLATLPYRWLRARIVRAWAAADLASGLGIFQH